LELTEIDAPAGTRDPAVLRTDDGGRAVLIRLGPGQAVGDHRVKEAAWVTVVEGDVRVEAGGETAEGGAGSLFRFDPDERHSVSTAAGARILLFLARFPAPGHYRGHERAASL
jgi:quercetin dioxygenase-like cupin family protein